MRNAYDLLKILATILVVVGHVTRLYPQADVLTKAIYLFHMPLFFALSGAVYQMGCDSGKYAQFGPFVVTKAKRLLVPFVLVGLFVLLPTLWVCGFAERGIFGTGVEILCGGAATRHLWFLQALFWTFLLVHGVRLVARWGVGCLAAGACLWMAWGWHVELFGLGLAFYYLPYFVLGMALRRCETDGIGRGRATILWLAALALWGLFYLGVSAQPAALFCQILLRCLIVSAVVSLVSLFWRRCAPKSEVSDRLLGDSFGIYLFHVPLIYLYYRYLGGTFSPSVEIPLVSVVSLFGGWGATEGLRRLHLGFAVGEFVRKTRLYFCDFANFGDALSPYLMKQLLGRDVLSATPAEADIMSVGSIFFEGEYFFFDRRKVFSRESVKWLWYRAKGLWQKPLVVWGSAFLHEPTIPANCRHYRRLDIRAVRGEKTKRCLKAAGFEVPEDVALGDPGLFYPELLDGGESIDKVYDLAIVPGYEDMDEAKALRDRLAEIGVKTILVDVLQKDPLHVLRQIAASRKVVASAMHAMIVADAMGIPNRGITFGSYNAWKIGDYYSAFGMEAPQPLAAEECVACPRWVLEGIPDSPNVSPDQVRQVKARLRRVLA